MRVLITGGAGALAETLGPYLEERGHKVTLLDYVEVKSKYQSIVADIRNIDTLDKAMVDQDIVIHTAALHGVHIGKYKPSDFFDTNILGTYNVLKQAVKAGIKRVIHISSTSVYGISKKSSLEKTICVNESTKFNPLDINDLCKSQSEQICDYFRRLYNLDCITLRIGRFFKEDMIEFNLKKLYGAVDVIDVSQAIYKAIGAKNLIDNTFCISSKVLFKQEDYPLLINAADKIVEKYYPGATELIRRRGGILPKKIHRVIDIGKAERQLCYSPKYNFDLFISELHEHKEGEMIV